MRGRGTCGKCRIKLLKGEIEVTDVHREKLVKLNMEIDWRLACYSRCTGDLTLEIGQFDHLILADESEFEFQPQKGFGVAVDVGTTTLVTQLIDLSTAKVLAVETMLNPQVKFGADLISRIQSGIDGHASEMGRILRNAIGEMISRMIDKHPLTIKKVVMVGNAVMQLIFSDIDVSSLSRYPFHNDNPGLKIFMPAELGWSFPVQESILFYPSIGSFVGSDILAGIAATGLHTKDEITALVDLGTNGEIVVGNRHGIVCASTAAGPAFEGANISMGMRAVTGAISSLRLTNGEIEADIIGNADVKGICGSALIDAVAILHQLGMIGMFGEILSGENHVTIFENVQLTQKDINEFQLAKAAIAAGLEILTRTMDKNISDIAELYIAGGFGNYINVDHVVSTGMIEMDKDRIHKFGNTALIGAKMFLFSGPKIVDDILKITRHINLESDKDFQDIYVDKMLFL
jgi:uncharacterized 2Fe-2S/4Fe-4S cluster protein (DUF4445 family)